VVVRVRPLRDKEHGDAKCLTVNSQRELTHKISGGAEAHFTFDAVLPETSKQDDLFSLMGPSMIRRALEGVNSTIMAYGQTGSGKTHTMLGTADNPGFIPRFMQQLFREVEQRVTRDHLLVTATVQYVEIYNEALVDLLGDPATTNNGNKKPQIREARERGVFLENVVNTTVTNQEQVSPSCGALWVSVLSIGSWNPYTHTGDAASCEGLGSPDCCRDEDE
jgi:hypothetical protein